MASLFLGSFCRIAQTSLGPRTMLLKSLGTMIGSRETSYILLCNRSFLRTSSELLRRQPHLRATAGSTPSLPESINSFKNKVLSIVFHQMASFSSRSLQVSCPDFTVESAIHLYQVVYWSAVMCTLNSPKPLKVPLSPLAHFMTLVRGRRKLGMNPRRLLS